MPRRSDIAQLPIAQAVDILKSLKSIQNLNLLNKKHFSMIASFGYENDYMFHFQLTQNSKY